MHLGLILDMVRAGHRDRVALGPERSGLTFTALAEEAARGARVLIEAGAGSVGYLGENGPALPRLLFAATYAGIPIAPLNYRLAPEQVGALLSRLGQPLVVVDEKYLPLLQ